MTINIEYEADRKFDFDYEDIAKRVIAEAIDYESCPFEAEVSLTITDMDGIQSINKEFRQIDNPTDVLSFPLVDYAAAGDFEFLEDEDNQAALEYFNPDTGELMLGDIIICVDKVYEQALKYGHSNEREYAFLIAHSMMHLFGYDHMEPEEAALMESKQEDVLKRLNITRD